MALTYTIHLAHLPPEYPLYITLFTDVQNALYLRQQLFEGNQDFEYAFIDASMILSTTHVLTACFRALNDAIHNRLRTRNVHSEIVFALGSTNNIASTLRTFGLRPETRHLLAVKVGGRPLPPTSGPDSRSTSASAAVTDPAPQAGTVPTADTVCAHLSACVEGTALPFSDQVLAPFTDFRAVRKAYKLGVVGDGGKGNWKGGSGGKGLVDGRREAEGEAQSGRVSAEEREEMVVQVMGLMALRGS